MKIYVLTLTFYRKLSIQYIIYFYNYVLNIAWVEYFSILT